MKQAVLGGTCHVRKKDLPEHGSAPDVPRFHTFSCSITRALAQAAGVRPCGMFLNVAVELCVHVRTALYSAHVYIARSQQPDSSVAREVEASSMPAKKGQEQINSDHAPKFVHHACKDHTLSFEHCSLAERFL